MTKGLERAIVRWLRGLDRCPRFPASIVHSQQDLMGQPGTFAKIDAR